MINQTEHSIIDKIRNLIHDNKLEGGDKLLSEIVLSEKFKVSRRNIRTAISKLEEYDLVKKLPQSGTIISNIGHVALLGILDNILGLNKDNFKSLIETRILLEKSIVKLAAERRSKSELKQIEEKFIQYKKKTLLGEDATQEDMLFHLAIAKACDNPTLFALMLQITPKLITVFEYNRIASMTKYGPGDSIQESDTRYEKNTAMELGIHEAIYEAIKDQNSELAVKCMENHFAQLHCMVSFQDLFNG